MEATIDKDIPIIHIDISEFPNNPLLIDAIYIPTIGERKNLLTVIQTVANWTKNVFVIFSRNKPKWVEELRLQNVQFIDNFNNKFHKDFINYGSTNNPTLKISESYDIPSKRNFALDHAKANNFLHIGLVDDDIIIEEAQMNLVCNVFARSVFDIVGFYVVNYPDVSVIDHVERYITGTPSEVSISGNCLFLNTQSTLGFFPYIYNEDWIYIFSNIVAERKVGSLGYVRQLEHEPWKNIERVRFEQFGDIIIWGLYNNLTIQTNFPEDIHFWNKIYIEYKDHLQKLKLKDTQGTWGKVLDEALIQCNSFSPSDLGNFIYRLNLEIKKLHV